MFALIGFPLGHSMSPFIHKRLFELSEKNDDYELFEINPENLQQGFETAIEKYNGLNVTIPHKTEVIPYLDMLDESAKRYNAVNCVAKKDDKLIGYNTDCIGFLRSVPEDALRKQVLICCCGGSSAKRIHAFPARPVRRAVGPSNRGRRRPHARGREEGGLH